jgi:hypothetical protein
VHGARGARRGPLASAIAQTSTFGPASSAELRRYLEGDRELLPVHTSHHGLSQALREAGIDPGTVRLSIGVEDEADRVADLEQALAG